MLSVRVRYVELAAVICYIESVERTVSKPAAETQELFDRLPIVPQICPAYNLGKAYKIVSRIFEEEFKGFSVTTVQFSILVHIQILDGPGCNELAEHLGSDPSTISRIIDTLETKKMVNSRCGSDRRTRRYCLTDSGRAAIKEGLAGWQRANARVLERIGDDRWQEALALLRLLQQ
ncbi:MAG: MarR family transcriptional regulator [Spirochaetaceae bacterium]|nr:MAG: MarR family transcriptional regulator [Spirochaetaceae bacterium]